MSKSLPFTDSNILIKTFRQALALDEVYSTHYPPYFVLTLIHSTASDFNQISIIGAHQTRLIQNM